MSVEEAIARARAVAERLKGTGATASLTPSSISINPSTTSNANISATTTMGGTGTSVGNGEVNAVAEAALAAAFGSSTDGAGISGASSKRKRWGADSNDAPDGSNGPSTAVSDAIAAALAPPDPNKRPRAASGSNAEVSKKIWIPVDRNPGYNYIGLLIGPGGSKQRELVEQSGGNVRISIRGRGSSGSNSVPGQPEEPLHCLLEGNAENVANAERLIGELLNDSSKAQAEKDRQLAVVSANKESDNTGSTSASSYQPKPVTHLLGLNNNNSNATNPNAANFSSALPGHYGPANDSNAEAIEEKIGVPNGVVGFIIGKGGESITSMQRRSGCRVQIQKEHEMEPGSAQRVITLTSTTQESIAMCRGIIEEMVKERLRLNQEQQQQHQHQNQGLGGGGGFRAGVGAPGPGANAAAQAAQLQQALAQGQMHIPVQVPNNDVGLIIGKGGVTIRSIQERSGANVQIPQGPDADNPMIRTINITHPTKEGAEFAKNLIDEIMRGKMQHSGGYSGGATQSSAEVSIQVQIPDKDVGMCIGRQGCVIREMQQKTGTRIQIPSQPTPGYQYRIAIVSGPADGCQQVQEIISRISLEQSSQFVTNGVAFNQNVQGQYGQQQQMYGTQYGQQQQVQVQGQQGNVDYSAQWAAYYASLNANGSNATSTQAMANTTATAGVGTTQAPAPAPATGDASKDSAQPAPDAYYDAFFRYSYHYGEEAARKYYQAWSPPPGTPNPYGVNPNATIPEQSTAAPAPAATTEDASQIKDSSVRNVSNLPAWMNNASS
mmetsp:Transcript_5921/g.8600  ORF Transcript_5921/g.8600 Transcript_5921/m.8600 type:complete len:778 (-) Transcript_5921:446-2779(-)|eukprot:CAMPEP_0184861766 /NCGR_PEP_ID=MMETSP0580-20130426/6368_1 /TAXON_ID=1118495 /ORGANISM="Dactyliosolen fragilissimus" /LENGTH=777 /DNA_ID=CAMNT_0027359371 /DNA_START=197 /DNA_END=2530 /DNA_ORIENTATION=+